MTLLTISLILPWVALLPLVMTTQLTKPNTLTTVQQLLEKFKGQIIAALPEHMTAERMIRIALTCVSQTPLLQKCDPYTICGAVVQSSILGLEPNSALGESFLIPYWNHKANKGKGGYDCQLQVGYKGHLKLAQNSGQLKDVDAQPVHFNDDFSFQKGSEPRLTHSWNPKAPRGELIGYYADFHTVVGAYNFEYWTMEQIQEHRDHYSQGAYKREAGKVVLVDGNKILQGPWKDSPDWMCRKTVLIQVLKLAPKSVQQQQALSLDERSDAGLPQKYSVDVPIEFQPLPQAEEAEEPQPPPEEPVSGERKPPASSR